MTDEFARAVSECRDVWVPANGGTETEYRNRDGRRVLYCFNPQQHRHAWIDLDTDMEIEERGAGQ